ncbi:MAG: adenylyltransferase/cytidyltransferase family protein [Candidatus Micrarchaeota archaeon]|nr:adenylyltransferase/cytidyltransferase family protein [Candidatus Micrarchaeota archaeon]
MRKILVGGTFNLIHPGHKFFLEKAKEHGDYLIVVIATDETVKNRKGYLFASAKERKKNVEQLGIADKVIIGDEHDWGKTIERERPDIVVLGYDQKLFPSLENKIMSMGIDIKRIGKFGNYSTSLLAKRKK